MAEGMKVKVNIAALSKVGDFSLLWVICLFLRKGQIPTTVKVEHVTQQKPLFAFP